jgi:hypothetical protein
LRPVSIKHNVNYLKIIKNLAAFLSFTVECALLLPLVLPERTEPPKLLKESPYCETIGEFAVLFPVVTCCCPKTSVEIQSKSADSISFMDIKVGINAEKGKVNKKIY